MKAGKTILLAVVVIAAVALYFGGGSEYLTLAKLQSLLG